MIEIDGSHGEGGGQILRTSLALSILTGQPVHFFNIRAGRKKPGLARQHLTSVLAAAEISDAEVVGANIGSQELSFTPKAGKGGKYRFDIGTAGSCCLVMQTVLPVLMAAEEDSEVAFIGGTHNPTCPPYHFLERAFVPLLRKMGIDIALTLNRFGFYPAGGGEIVMAIKGGQSLKPISIMERGELKKCYAESLISRLPMTIAERELVVVDGFCHETHAKDIKNSFGQGNALLITMEYDNVSEVFVGFGERGVSAESIAHKTLERAKEYSASSAVVSEYLADQLLLPMALAGGGSFTATEWSLHSETNAEIIGRFLPITVDTENENGMVRVTVSR